MGNSSDHSIIEIYREMGVGGGIGFNEAVRRLGLNEEEVANARAQLDRLGLLTAREDDPSSLIPVSPEVAIVAALAHSREELGRYRDTVAQTHEALQQLVSNFLPLSGQMRHEMRFEVMRDLRQVAAYLDSSTSLARHEVLTMHPGATSAPHLQREAQARNRELAERAVRMRTLYQLSSVTHPRVASTVREVALLGFEVRVTAVVPIRLIIFDRQRAVIPIDPHDGRAGAVAIEGEILVASLAALYDYCWQHAFGLDDLPLGGSEHSLSPQQLAVLQMLGAGLKDEKMARNLGVSVRTVSRLVGELMDRLGAESRFQAGVRAVKLGWVE